MDNERRPPLPQTSSVGIGTVALVVAAALAVWLLRYPYAYGYGDQDEFLPYLLRLLDNGLFQADWFVQTQLNHIGVRTYFVFLLRALCLLLTPEVAVALVFGGCWIAIAAGVARITIRMGGRSLGVFLSVVGALCLTPKWTLGGNDLVYTMLVPEMVAWVLVLFGLLSFGSGRYALAGILLGVAAWFQLLAGVLTAGLLALDLAIPRNGKPRFKQALLLGTAAALTAIPILVPVALQQLSGGAVPDTDPSSLFILAEFRAPHHYLPSAFSTGSWLRFTLLAIVGGPSAWWLARRRSHREADLPVVRILLLIAAVCLVSWFFTEVVPIELFVKLQVFKLTVLAKILLIVAIAIAVESLVLASTSWPAESSASPVRVASIAILAAAAGLGLWRQVADDGGSRADDAWRAASVESWAYENTAIDAVFALPPSNSSFRSFARRAVVVNYAAVPFAPRDMAEWYARLQAIAPIDVALSDRRTVSRLDSAFHSRTSEDWMRLADTYAIDYLVQRSGVGANIPFEVAFRDSAWVAYRVTARTGRE